MGATVLAVVLTTLILASVVSLGQGWLLRNQKVDLVSTLTATGSQSDLDNAAHAVYLSSHDTEFNAMPIREIGIEKTNQSEDLPAGLTTIPTEGELWATPALKRLIDANPTLQERYASYVIRDSFPEELASSPSSLMLLYRAPAAAVHSQVGAQWTSTADELRVAYKVYRAHGDTSQTVLLRTALMIIGVIVITPMILLVAEVSRIGIAQRQRKYAALGLVGATQAQIRSLVVLEALPLSLLGSVLGVVLFTQVGLPLLALLPIGSEMIWLHDLYLSLGTLAVICGVVTGCSLLANLYAARSAQLSPLTVTRTNIDMKKPSLASTLPLLIGVGGLYMLSISTAWYRSHTELGGIILALLMLIIISGIFICGPYVVYATSNLLVRYARSASTILAGYRLRMVSRSVFRSISGVVIALFVGAMLMASLATMQAANEQQSIANDAVAPKDPLQVPLQVTVALPDLAIDKGSTLRQALMDDIRLANASAHQYTQKGFIEDVRPEDDTGSAVQGMYYESCEQLQRQTKVTCSVDDKAPIVAKSQFVRNSSGLVSMRPQLTSVVGFRGVIFEKSYILVAKDDISFNDMVARVYAITGDYQRETGVSAPVGYERIDTVSPTIAIQNLSGLIMVMIISMIIIGGLSIFVSVTGGLFERKRTFVQLRIIGVGTGNLLKALLIEIIIPLMLLSLITVGLGIFCCYCLLSTGGAMGGRLDFYMPGDAFWIAFCVAIVLCVTTSLISVPLLSKLTDSEDLRSE